MINLRSLLPILYMNSKGHVEICFNTSYNTVLSFSFLFPMQPVGLCVEVPTGAGTVQCCSPQAPCRNFVHDPDAQCFKLTGWCLCQSYPPCPRPVVTSMCSNSSTLTPTPGQILPVTLASACFNQARVDMPFTQDNLSVPKQCLVSQCVCSAGVSEEKITCQCQYETREIQIHDGNKSGDLLRNLLLIGASGDEGASDENNEQLLKRVNSAPSTNILPLKPHFHIPLASSHSLDTGRCIHQTYPPNAKLRLRASSSRFLSHHSSSTEEWFEEVLISQGTNNCGDTSCNKSVAYAQSESKNISKNTDSPAFISQNLINVDRKSPVSEENQDATLCDPISQMEEECGGDSLGAESMGECSAQREECHSTKKSYMDHGHSSTEHHSLNNLLLADSCDQLSVKNLTHSESSLSVHYSEDSVSTAGRLLKDGETVSQAPTFDIADVDPSEVCTSKPHKICQKPISKASADMSENPPRHCCCVLS